MSVFLLQKLNHMHEFFLYYLFFSHCDIVPPSYSNYFLLDLWNFYPICQIPGLLTVTVDVCASVWVYHFFIESSAIYRHLALIESITVSHIVTNNMNKSSINAACAQYANILFWWKVTLCHMPSLWFCCYHNFLNKVFLF